MPDQSIETTSEDFLIVNGHVPDTPFQRWLGKHGACTSVRQDVGDMHPQQAWGLWQSLDDMKWLMWRLPQVKPYLRDCGCCFEERAFGGRSIPYDASELRLTIPELTTEMLAELGYPPTDPRAEVSIYHAVMRDETITFLDKDTRDQWLARAIDMSIVLCESKIDKQFYDAMLNWHKVEEARK